MKKKDYNEICQFIASHPPSLLRTVLHNLRKKFECQFSYDTLLSIALIYHQQQMKKTYAGKSTDKKVQLYFDLYVDKVSKIKTTELRGKRQSILLDLSVKYAVPPALLSRLILKRYLLSQQTYNNENPDEDAMHIKTGLSKMMKNPFLIPDETLSYEVRQCIINDAGYGSVTDSIRHMVGLKYEDELVNHVKSLHIPYLDETDLRKLGYDKTPDIKLEIPIAVDGMVVCWIESKASFGSPEAHNKYLNEQYYSYWNRFGSGLVIYWFGFVDELAADMRQQGILLMDRFPPLSDITRFDPSCTQSAKTLQIIS